MGNKKGVVMLGSGGHAAACTDLIESIKTYSVTFGGSIEIARTIKDTRLMEASHWDALCREYDTFVLGVGQIHDCGPRKRIVKEVHERGGRFATLISPYAKVSSSCRIGEGTVIMPNVVVGPRVEISRYCILNTGCIVEHDSVIGKGTHISTGAILNGDCFIGSESFLGSNAVLLNQIAIDDNVSVGAGSVVTKNLKGGSIFVGNPATFLRLRD